MMAFKVICFALTLISVAALASAAAAAADTRFVGGSPTTINDFPFVVSINYIYMQANVKVQRCVGSLISSWHVLTTAFCFTSADLTKMSVRAGSTNSMSGGTVSGIREVIIHPEYEQTPRHADIAIVVLTDFFAITDAINVVYIPPQGTYLPEGHPVLTIGWGFDGPGGNQLENLQLISTSIYPQDRCLQAHASNEEISIYDQVLCTSEADRSMCRGGSGAPLVIGNVLVGLSSYYGACDSSVPDVFSRIDRHTGWILENAVAPTRQGVLIKVAPISAF